jgi:hypothetical protein
MKKTITNNLLWHTEDEEHIDSTMVISLPIEQSLIVEINDNIEELAEELEAVDSNHLTVVYYTIDKNAYSINIARSQLGVLQYSDEDIDATLKIVEMVMQGFISLMKMRDDVYEFLKANTNIATRIYDLTFHDILDFCSNVDEVTYPDDVKRTIIHTTSKLLPDEVKKNFNACKDTKKKHDIFTADLCDYVTNEGYYVCDLWYGGQTGLYETHLGMVVEDMMYESGKTYEEITRVVGRYYAEALGECISEMVESVTALYPTIKFKSHGISSPKFYNYETDTLIISTDDIAVIYKALLLSTVVDEEDQDSWYAWKKRVTTGVDGYIPFHKMTDFNKPIANWTEAQKATLLSYLVYMADKDERFEYISINYTGYLK